MTAEPVTLASVIAAIAAAFPLTPQRARANARLLEEETAVFDAGHPELREDRKEMADVR